MEELIGRLRNAGAVKSEIVACDATFIKAYSKRGPEDDSRGYSDHDARVRIPPGPPLSQVRAQKFSLLQHIIALNAISYQ